MGERTKQGMGLTTDSLEAILKDLQTYDTSDVGPAMRLRAYVFVHKDNAAGPQGDRGRAPRSSSRARPPRPGWWRPAGRSGSSADRIPCPCSRPSRSSRRRPTRPATRSSGSPGAKADRALVEALGKTAGAIKRGVVFSLGERKTAAAVPALAGWPREGRGPSCGRRQGAGQDRRPGGRQGPRPRCSASPAPRSSPRSLRPCFSRPRASSQAGDKAAAASVYDKVFAANISPVSRQAAFKGRLAVADDAKGLILKALAGNDAAPLWAGLGGGPGEFRHRRHPAGRRSHDAPARGRQDPARRRFWPISRRDRPSVSAVRRGERLPSRSGWPRCGRSPSAGDGKSVVFLATKAARTAGAEQDAAREALARLKGLDVDEAVLAHLAKTSDDAVKAELVQAAGARQHRRGRAGAHGHGQGRTGRAQGQGGGRAPHAGRRGGHPGLARPPRRARRRDGPRSHAGYRRGGRPDEPEEHQPRRARSRRGYAAEKDLRKQADLLRDPGQDRRRLGPAPRPGGAGRCRNEAVVDAAVRALADWPTVAARDDVLDVARTSIVLNHRVLSHAGRDPHDRARALPVARGRRGRPPEGPGPLAAAGGEEARPGASRPLPLRHVAQDGRVAPGRPDGRGRGQARRRPHPQSLEIKEGSNLGTSQTSEFPPDLLKT
ncbi:MAG: hypothetical protein MZV64_12780 [Ignavibacteriales bacterium]|nr:hypothetical protein [Ignavibacteriales bacterium]